MTYIAGSETVATGASITAVTNNPPTQPGGVCTAGQQEFFFDDITAGAGTAAQRTLTLNFDVRVDNDVNANAGDVATNTAELQITSGAGVATFAFPTVSATIREDAINDGGTTTIAVAPAAGYDAGDTLTYTVTVTNPATNGGGAAAAPARDLRFDIDLPAEVTYTPASVALTTTPALGCGLTVPDISAANVISFGRATGAADNCDLGPGETVEFTFEVTADDALQPTQAVVSDLVVDWTSLDGDPGPALTTSTVGVGGTTTGERTGAGVAPNDLRSTATATATAAAAYTNVSKTFADAGGVALGANDFRVGEIITYTVETTLQQGTTQNVVITDTQAPANLEFLTGTATLTSPGVVATTAPTAAGEIQVAALTLADPANVSGTMVFNAGTVVVGGGAGTGTATLRLS